MSETFPKRKITGKIAEVGINVASTIFNDHFGWIFRRTHQEHDFGIDGYVDYVSDEGNVTGQSIAVQIKTGKSYLSATGSMHWYKDSIGHLNYFLNLPTPIILIICDPDIRACYWAVLDKGKVDYDENGWRHPIPKLQILDHAQKNIIQNFFGETTNHIADFQEDQRLLKSITEDTFIQYSVPRRDIIELNTTNLRSFIDRLIRNEKLSLAIQGKLYISTYGYEFDKREVHEIKEIRRWAKKARKTINEWYLCSGNEKRFSTILWMATCTCGTKTVPSPSAAAKGRVLVESNPEELITFMQECFAGLNEACDKWGWSHDMNYRISQQIHEELFSEIPFPKRS